MVASLLHHFWLQSERYSGLENAHIHPTVCCGGLTLLHSFSHIYQHHPISQAALPGLMNFLPTIM